MYDFKDKVAVITGGAHGKPEYKVQAIGMDGFLRRQEYLKSHTMMLDGKG